MTQINGVKIPSMPGSCYHAIICSLAEYKDQFCPWNKIIERTEYYMRMYGGDGNWEKFRTKGGVKTSQQRIKDNVHTLTRTGKDCYGFRLHEKGMCIYFFKDGAILFTGGEFRRGGNGKYQVRFSDGRKLQFRYRGTTMTYKEYRKFLELEYIDLSGKLLQPERIKEFRANVHAFRREKDDQNRVHVSITLDDSYNQATACRLYSLGLIVNHSSDNEIDGTVPADKLDYIMEDEDVVDVITYSPT